MGFGLVTPTPDGIVVFLRGDVWCEVVHGGTTTTLTGRDALTWVDRVVPEPIDRVGVGVGPARELHPPRRSDLSAGVVPGGGFVREPARAGAPSAVSTADAGSVGAPPAAPSPPRRRLP